MFKTDFRIVVQYVLSELSQPIENKIVQRKKIGFRCSHCFFFNQTAAEK